MKVKIRGAKSNDWQDIQRLNNQVFLNDEENDDDLDMDWPFSEEGIDYYKKAASGEYGKCFLAVSESEIVGYVILVEKDFGYRKSKYIEVANIGVAPEHRSKGIGSKLLNKCAEWAREQEAGRLFVSAYWGNKKAIKFYKENGFFETGVELEKEI